MQIRIKQYLRAMLKGLFICLPFLFLACKSKPDTLANKTSRIVAKVNEQELSLEDLQPYLLSGLSPRDSTKMAQRFIEQWAADQLLFLKASESLDEADQSVEKEVERYRKTLINHRLEEKLIEENLDTTINKTEIENYYNNHKESFILKDNIAKVNYVKVPLTSNAIEKIKKMLQANQPKDKDQLKALCLQNAENYFLNDSTWLLMDDIRKEIPRLREEADLNFSNGKTIEYSENGYYYYLRIKEIRTKNSVSPLNFERQGIRTFILNERKANVLKQYRQQLLDKAREDKKLLIF